MKIFKNKEDLKSQIINDISISFIPTMGGLHKGHIFLIKKAKKKKNKTLVSIYVNPKQFNKKEDYKKYPRNLKKDIKILLVDDEPDIIEIVRFNLEKVGYQIFTASDGLEALRVAEKELPHLIILDVMMPNLDGIETCERLRQDSRFNDTVIMVLTARGEDYSYVAAFEVGADDYVTKPIKPKVLVSKVKGLLRRFKETSLNDKTLEFLDLSIDKDKHKVVFKKQELFLPRKEFELLYLLASKPGKVFKRNNIMENVWGNEVIVGDRTIDVHIRKLREKLGDHFLKTVKGVGYKFIEPEN